MKIVKVAPLTLTVELDPTDCIALYVACQKATAHYDYEYPVPQLDAIGAALLLALLAIGDRDMDEGPLTIQSPETPPRRYGADPRPMLDEGPPSPPACAASPLPRICA